ncbi:FAD binding domain-containing protein [Marinivivus vitaminiproducens]|uniref:FAD binding domain-containing protein n=1 Tax=Marinivivus vitaminiproducens TaxID=3035935 RepID=UPI0027A984C5|nr:FAD binding domain-containing protein [Geminicoccaceae bacterium SCSIO 64248]
MKPARFALARPRDLETALSLLAEAGEAGKIMAGGQSLGPMLNLRLVEPELVIDIAGIEELRRFGHEGDRLVIGACITHADIEDGRVPDIGDGVLARVASGIAYRAVRNRGTLGGSLAHADPAADWLTTLMALDAMVEVASKAARRRVPLGSFVTGALATALEPGELITALHVPAIAKGARFGFVKHCRKVGEFAHAMSAVVIDPERDRLRAVTGAIDAPPLVIEDAHALLGKTRSSGSVRRFDPGIVDAAFQTAGIEDAVDRHVHATVLRRAIENAWPVMPDRSRRQAA